MLIRAIFLVITLVNVTYCGHITIAGKTIEKGSVICHSSKDARNCDVRSTGKPFLCRTGFAQSSAKKKCAAKPKADCYPDMCGHCEEFWVLNGQDVSRLCAS